MRLPKVIFPLSGLILLILLALLLPPRGGVHGPLVTFGSVKRGHLGDYYSDSFSVGSVSNRTTFQLSLKGQFIQRQRADGTIVSDNVAVWNGKEQEVFLSAGNTVSIPVETQSEFPRFRICFDYGWSAGRFVVALSRLAQWIPVRRLPDWFYRHGLFDGQYHRVYVSDWVSNESVQPPKPSTRSRPNTPTP